MKRGGPPASRTPLTSSTPLSRSSSLSRTGLSRKAPQGPGDGPRHSSPLPSARPKVTTEERRGRKLLRSRSGGRCEIGGTCPAQEAHHRQNRSQGGTWDVVNLLHLCHAHHLHVTTNPAAARQQGWAVLSTDDPARTPAWLAGRGFTYLRPDGAISPTEGAAA